MLFFCVVFGSCLPSLFRECGRCRELPSRFLFWWRYPCGFAGEHAKAPEISIDPNLVQQAERELQEAVNTAIDDDDDDL